MTTRFQRDSRLAFRNHCDYACSVERPAPRYPKLLWVVIALGFAVAIFTVRTS